MNLTNEQIRIAEASGYEKQVRSEAWWNRSLGKHFLSGELPPFHSSLDAIQAAVMGQSDAWQDIFDDELYDILSKSNTKRFRHQLTPAQWCLAFIATLDTIEAKQKEGA